MNDQTQKLTFDQQLANYIAALAKLDPNHPALAHLVTDMERVLSMVEVMNQVDTQGIEPLRHPLDLPHLQREDKATTIDNRKQLLNNAPATADELFLVPPVIE